MQLKKNVINMIFAKPHFAIENEIEKIIENFIHAIEYFYIVDFDDIKIHDAHKYLLTQFLTLNINKKIDKYENNLKNRMCLIMKIAQRIYTRVFPNFILNIKINSVEFQKNNFSIEKTKTLYALLKKKKFDFVELNEKMYKNLIFNYKRDFIKKRETFFFDFAKQIVRLLKQTKIYITKNFKTIEMIINILNIVDDVEFV